MTAFNLDEIIADTSAVNSDIRVVQTRQCDESFDARLRAKLEQPPRLHHRDICVDRQSDDVTFNAVRTLFSNSSKALDLELKQRDIVLPGAGDSILSHCHWIPGRIEVMGKHTDYAGGNSLGTVE
mmetsp:Transcript_55878/g.118834  ORF Transcript_55878/g.118834 Transcript_55878/m.118834 type:complete len:125 (-) Transcript_55878:1-375(-)